MSQVQQLYQLQQIDTEMREKKQRLGEVLRAQKETKALLAARKRLETAVADLQTWQSKRQDLDLELQSLKNKAKSAERRLYSGSVKNPKELTDLQHAIESMGRQRAALEDELLEAMIMIEDVETEQTAADQSLQTITAAWEKEQAGLKREQNELALRLHTLTGQRQEITAQISAQLLAEYDSLIQKNRGVAIAKLQQGICQGCRLNVSERTAKSVQEGRLTHCNSCGRILAG